MCVYVYPHTHEHAYTYLHIHTQASMHTKNQKWIEIKQANSIWIFSINWTKHLPGFREGLPDLCPGYGWREAESHKQLLGVLPWRHYSNPAWAVCVWRFSHTQTKRHPSKHTPNTLEKRFLEWSKSSKSMKRSLIICSLEVCQKAHIIATFLNTASLLHWASQHCYRVQIRKCQGQIRKWLIKLAGAGNNSS